MPCIDFGLLYVSVKVKVKVNVAGIEIAVLTLGKPVMIGIARGEIIYLVAASSKSFDHRSRELDGKRRRRARIWTGNWIARPNWTH